MADDLVRKFLEQRESLLAYALALTHDRDAAEEIFQEVGVAIVEEAHKGTAVANFLAWAHEIIRRRVAEFYRKGSRRRMARLDSLDEVVGQAFEENAIATDTRLLREEVLEECIEELPPAQKQMIEQRYREQSSMREIAKTLDWTDGAVKVALWKVRRRLADCIDGKLGRRDEA